MEKSGVKIAAQNRKAFHDYFVEDRCEAGIELFGTEVKSIRAGTLNLKDSFCVAKDGEIYAYSLHISPYEQGNIFNRDPDRPKRLLLHNAFSAFLTNLSPKNKWLAAGVLLGIGALSGLIGLCLKGGSTDMSTAIWIAAIIIFGVVEAVTAGLTSIWFVLGSMAGLVAAVCNGPIWLQVTLFFVVSIVALAATRPLVTKLMKKDIKPTNADRVLGGSARVTERIDNDVPTGAVYIDGKTWSARSSTGEIIEPDAMVRVIRMEGVKLYVEKEA